MSAAVSFVNENGERPENCRFSPRASALTVNDSRSNLKYKEPL
jgi:hypothetical protein